MRNKVGTTTVEEKNQMLIDAVLAAKQEGVTLEEALRVVDDASPAWQQFVRDVYEGRVK